MIELTQEQRRAYKHFIKCRDKVSLVKTNGNRHNTWVRLADVVESVEIPNSNHPLFLQNDDWLECKQAYLDWLAIEPQWRKDERMRMSRGDYDTQDSWEEKGAKVTDIYNKVKEA